MSSIYDIKDNEIKIDGKPWDDADLKTLSAKHIQQFSKAVQYFRPWIERGEDLFDKYSGKIIDDEQRRIYEDVEDKIVVEPRKMKAPIRSLVGQVMKGRRSGSIVTESGDIDNPATSSDEIAVISAVMKDIEKKTKEKYLIRDAVHDAFVSCYPNVIYWDKAFPGDDGAAGKIKRVKLPWNSCVFSPITFKEPDGSDIKELFFFDWFSRSQLVEIYPDRKEQIDEHFALFKSSDASNLSSLSQWDDVTTAADRGLLYSALNASDLSINSPAGLVLTYFHLYPIKEKTEVWYNIFDESGNDYEIRPPEWSNERWNEWVTKNSQKYQGPFEKEVTTLWFFVGTQSGLVLANEAHWFQENGKLPASFWIPAMINGVPSGPADDMRDDTVAKCVAEIEWLDDLRKGSGTLTIFKEGALTPDSAANITSEANKAFGFGFVSKDYPDSPANSFAQIKRTPNDAWKVYAEQRMQEMYDTTRINESMQGGSAPRQSAIAKELEISQALVVNAIYIDNVNRSWEYEQNLKISMIPYAYDEWMVIDVEDEETKEVAPMEINAPQQFDDEGNPTQIVNDLTSKKYKWKLAAVDDSPTAKSQAREEALSVINSVAGPLLGKDPTGKLFARFLSSWDNDFLKQAGKMMTEEAEAASNGAAQVEQQKAQQEMKIELMKATADTERARKAGKTVSITGADIAQYPQLVNLLQQWGMLNAESRTTAPEGMPQSAPATPPQQPQTTQPMQPQMQVA